jgi:hypothetical protein
VPPAAIGDLMIEKKQAKSEASVPRHLTASAAAKFFKVSGSTVNAWLTEGMPSVRRGKQGAVVHLDLVKIAPWVAARRAAKADSARVTVSQEQAEKLRLANARSRREVILASEVQLMFHEATASMVQNCEAMPQRVSADPEVQAKVRDECRNLRSAFADRLEALSPG